MAPAEELTDQHVMSCSVNSSQGKLRQELHKITVMMNFCDQIQLYFQVPYEIIKEQTHLSNSGNVFLEKVKLLEIGSRLNVIIHDPKGSS